MRSVIRRVSDFLNALLRRRARPERDLDDEIQFHLREETRLRAADGLSPDDAAVSAHRVFGNVQLVKERTRETWSGHFADTLMLRKHRTKVIRRKIAPGLIYTKIIDFRVPRRIFVLRADVAEWDSLSHVEIIYGVEESTGVMFSEQEMAGLGGSVSE